MKWSMFLIVMLIVLLPQPLLFSYTQSLDGRSVKLVESTNYGLTSSNGYVNVNVSEAKQMIETNPNLVTLDVRTQEEYNEGHIENAVLIPVNELEERIDELDNEKETLVYCRSGVRSVTASEILVANGFKAVYNMLGGITAWRNAGYWVEIIHTGDLIIDGTQTYIIENCTYTQTGDIIVEDYAKLVFRNAELILNHSENDEVDIDIRDSGQFWSTNLDIWRAENVRVNLFLTYSSFANLTLVKFRSLNPMQHGFYDIFVRGRLFLQECFFEGTLMCPGFSSVRGSYIRSVYANGEVIISDSDVCFVHLWVRGDSVVEVRGLMGYNFGRNFTINYFNPFQNLTSVGPLDASNLTILNSRVIEGGISLSFVDKSRGRIYNSILYEIEVNHYANLGIENSTFQYVTFSTCEPYTGNTISLFNSTIATLLFAGPPIGVERATRNAFFSNCTLTQIIASSDSSGYIWGNITFQGFSYYHAFQGLYYPGMVPVGVYWGIDTNVARNFNVVIARAGNKSMTDVELKLCDQNNTVLWAALADTTSQVSFNCTFNDINNTDALRLEAVKGNYSATMNIGLLSDTPIVLTMRYFADLNGDSTINIVDISIVAMAFGATPEDPEWNVIADLNNDQIINILDIATVAKDYGKTV